MLGSTKITSHEFNERDGKLHQLDKCRECTVSVIKNGCVHCKSFMAFLAKEVAEPYVECEFDSVMDEYDPHEDPDEALWNEYYNPGPEECIDALRAGDTFDWF